MRKFYLTTPIFYPNAKLHMGHAYTTVLADVIARHHRFLGDDTYLLTGSDENTEKLVRAAEASGVSTSEFLEGIIVNFKALFGALGSSYDQFIRTSDVSVHHPGAQQLWTKLVEAGDIYKAPYEGLYCVGHESFITEKDLVDGKCPDHGTEPERLSEENYFFKLSRYTKEIQKRIEADDIEIVPKTRKNEILSLLEAGLEDISFSRPSTAVSVGIPVPGDESQRMYVWCDALSNYITGVGYGRDESMFARYWPADLHVMGKDILRFHAAIWPAMLLSAGLPLPKKLLVHGFITSGGKKMSKTLGNVIDPLDLIEQYGGEAVRYYLARHISPFEDGDLTESSFKDSYNGNLANGLGNLASRILTLAEKYVDGEVVFSEALPQAYLDAFTDLQVNRAADVVWEHIGELDRTIQKTEPFKLVKENPEEGKKAIGALVSELYTIGLMLRPFMPQTAETLLQATVAKKKPENLFPRKD